MHYHVAFSIQHLESSGGAYGTNSGNVFALEHMYDWCIIRSQKLSETERGVQVYVLSCRKLRCPFAQIKGMTTFVGLGTKAGV